MSIGAGWLFYQARNQALWEGVLALAAAVSVASLTVHMWRHARRIKRDIEGHLQSSTLRSGGAAFAGVFLFTLLMITREGMETALLMGTLLFQMQAPFDMVIGAVGGMTVAAFVASLWSRFGHRVNLGLFFQVTAVFLMIFVVQLLIYGFHELTEANIFPYSEPLHIATEPYGPDGLYGKYLTYLLVLHADGMARVCVDVRWPQSHSEADSRASKLGPMRLTTIHSTVALWVAVSSWSFPFAQTTLPRGAVALINQDHHGSRVALCADTGEAPVQQGAKKIRGTAVWVGEGTSLRRIRAGLGACDPSWSPDGQRLAVTAADGLWVFPANSPEGALRVESRLPLGSIEFNFRAFSSPRWSPDGCCSDWLSPTVVRRGWRCSRPAAAGFSTRLLRSTPPSPGRPHET